MKYTCQILTALLRERGIKDVIVSPGSRNSSLITAFDESPDFDIRVIIDERSAAFCALGRAMTTRQPTVLVCTSGTAVLNYAPAVAEAYYQGIPLIVISADRPLEWIDQDDSQTIRQNNVLSNFVKASYDIHDLTYNDEEQIWYSSRLINDALSNTTSQRPGPVHINMRFREPLNDVDSPRCDIRNILDISPSGQLRPNEVKTLAYQASQLKIMIICGFETPNWKINKAINQLTALPNVTVLSESISNLHGAYINNNIDRTLACLDKQDTRYYPDLLISFGGSLVSRMLKTYIRDIRPKYNWYIGYQNNLSDCFKSLTTRILTPPDKFFPSFAAALKKFKPESDYSKLWSDLYINATKRHNFFTKNSPWCSLWVFDQIMCNIPDHYNLHLSNGTSIRYAQLCDNGHPHATYCNRGVSGIDGCTSTAIGSAQCYSCPTLLITGDMSFAYDIGALSISDIPNNFKIIVINNNGGDIFRFIGSTSQLSHREKYFCAKPFLPLAQLCDAYGFNYSSAANKEELISVLPKFFNYNQQKSILEINLKNSDSAEILKQYFKRI